jgi:preprotein translocase subunit SecB
MADKKDAPKGSDDARNVDGGEQAAQKPIEAHVVGQFIKDLSFENPNIGRILAKPGETPNIKLEINVSAKQVQPELFESAIDFKAVASNTEGTIYDFELVYAGLFQLKNIPEQALEPFLLINCPTLIFPFLRRIVADITREGGFPPLMLDPIDFGQLFMRRRQELAAAAASGKLN